MLKLSDKISMLSGIGPAKEKAFSRLGIHTVRELLFHIPRGYEDRSHIRTLEEGKDGAQSTFLLTVGSVPHTVRLRSRMTLTKFRAFDASGSVTVVFFNQDYLKNVFTLGDEFRFTGKLSAQGRAYQLSSPKYEKYDPLDPPADIYPVYALTEGISGNLLRKTISAAMREALSSLEDYLPEQLRQRHGFPTLATALRALHEPEDFDAVKAASRRLAYDDLFLFSLGVRLSREKQLKRSVSPIPFPNEGVFFSKFPYEPTGAQRRVCKEIAQDMASGHLMNRILVGDVGCGKTLCAAFAAFAAMSANKQAAILAPTEILARQHYGDLSPLFASFGFRTALLLGSSTAKEKREIYAAAEKGELDLIIGTHALFNEKLNFSALGLIVADEQHRFGVAQRAHLREKCPDAHMLVMSATPIPRTLALVLYGDLDISRIDEMPKGRRPVATYVVNEDYRARLYAFIEKQVALGGQVYVVCPAIEPKEELEEGEIAYSLFREDTAPMKNATEVAEDIRRACPTLSVGFLHGKMKSAEKDAVMSAFACGEHNVLVSTTVIEVGVNVPNASLMIVEDADRFGLAQLHQLRGRVGRGTRESFCVLVSSARGGVAKDRLETMRTTFDGFAVAEADLKQRGPGDFLAPADGGAIRQSGGLSFRFATVCTDSELLSYATEDAEAILAGKGELHENDVLLCEVKSLFESRVENIS